MNNQKKARISIQPLQKGSDASCDDAARGAAASAAAPVLKTAKTNKPIIRVLQEGGTSMGC